MAKVRILPDRVANQIAAGEVIERPAAVIKELVENALDAGATRIEVEFRHGGRSYMRVEDNGHGMNRDDALMALERHATSKIAEAADLDRLGSYGFRGEALPSIASVSRFELQTREEGKDAGVEVLVNGGKLVHVRDCGRPVGTRFVVTHLFHPVPARRKFLKSDQTESAHIIQSVRLYALACPQAAFTLIENGRVIFRSPECATLEERVAGIFGRQTAEALVPIEAEESGMTLTGLIGRPGTGRATRHEMVVFVNQRPVDSRTLNYALIESYHETLPKGRYPLAFVFFQCHPAEVDVNVHPAKREVRFHREPVVRGFVIRSVLARLQELTRAGGPGSAVPAPAEPAMPRTMPPAAVPPATGAGQNRSPVSRPLPGSTFGSGAPMPRPAPAPVVTTPAAPKPVVSDVPTPGAPSAAPATMPAWRLLGIAHGNFALFETAAGLVLLDRRAAHERVWFERLRRQFGEGNVPAQRLLLPVPVELDPVASALLLERLEFLGAHGFEVAEFGRNFFRIEAVPAWMEPGDAEPFLRDLLGLLREGRLQTGRAEVLREELARLAAAKAVRLPETASAEEMRALVTQLFQTERPLTSPEGRATYIELNHSELARRFQK
ncbi:MAG: DNA mismatch repair endonuclease MutL [Opitutaceae bacterium]|nr:DNA mismatch repair endonuclease MutL [Opitutaceae bacterium]